MQSTDFVFVKPKPQEEPKVYNSSTTVHINIPTTGMSISEVSAINCEIESLLVQLRENWSRMITNANTEKYPKSEFMENILRKEKALLLEQLQYYYDRALTYFK